MTLRETCKLFDTKDNSSVYYDAEADNYFFVNVPNGSDFKQFDEMPEDWPLIEVGTIVLEFSARFVHSERFPIVGRNVKTDRIRQTEQLGVVSRDQILAVAR